jgi:hypothetical protein
MIGFVDMESYFLLSYAFSEKFVDEISAVFISIPPILKLPFSNGTGSGWAYRRFKRTYTC